jgi:hypothetical protein
MRHMKEPFEYHDEEWDTFERYLKSCETSNQANFNPFEVVFSDPPHLGSAKQTHLYLLSDFRDSESNEETPPPGPPKGTADKALQKAMEVLQPPGNVSGSEFPGRPSPEELFEIPRPPELPHLPSPPSLMLEDSAYPPNYFERPGGESAESIAYKAGKALAKTLANLRGDKNGLSTAEFLGARESVVSQTIYERKREYRIELMKRYESLLGLRETKTRGFVEARSEAIRKYKSLLVSKKLGEALEALQITNNKYPLPKFLRRGVKYEIDQEHGVCVIEFEFPDYRNENLIVGWSTRGGYINEDRPKFASEGMQRKS